MNRSVSTNFGEPLSSTSKKLVNEVRLKISWPIHPNFDKDFNIYRFVLAAERVHKREKDIIESAAKALNNHLRIRRALKLDYQSDISYERNRLFLDRLLPKGDLLDQTDNHNRLLWYVEYRTINVEALATFIRSSESIRLQFQQFEAMLRRVNKQEEKTGLLSGLRHIIDMTDYEINPFTMIFVSNGNLIYYSQLLHYENFPELVNPVEMVNIPKWINVPYQIFRTMMPESFTQRFRLHHGNFLSALLQEIKIENIPTTLGGTDANIVCQPAIEHLPEDRKPQIDQEFLKSLETFDLPPRKRRQIHVDVRDEGKRLQWYFMTDGDVIFGVYYEPFEAIPTFSKSVKNRRRYSHPNGDEEVNCDELEMVYPRLTLATKYVHEHDFVECTTPGRYWVIFYSKSNWFQKRQVGVAIQIVDKQTNSAKRCYLDGTFETTKPFSIPTPE